MLSSSLPFRIIAGTVLLISTTNPATAGELKDFRSDGCSLFPDGTLQQQDLWCECCVAHDIAYWQGGSRNQKKQADQALRQCVKRKTGNIPLADTMYYGVTLGGSPAFPTWYRWGYGWLYGRGFRPLSPHEKQQVEEKLRHYRIAMPTASCNAEHPLELLIRNEIQELFQQQ